MNDAILAAIREVAAIPAERRLWSLATIMESRGIVGNRGRRFDALSRHHEGPLNQRVTAPTAQSRHTASRKHPHAASRAPDAPDPHKEAEILAQHRERR